MNNSFELCPIIAYSSFKQFDDGNIKNCTTIKKFENDIIKLLNSNYKSISLSQINEYRKYNIPLPDKSFCIVFLGGYENNYSLAYPIIKKLGIYIDIFIATDLVGLNTYPGIDNFISHFNWQQANEMHSSNLINIYSLWHPFDNKKTDIEFAIKEKISLIDSNVKNNNSKVAFYMGENYFTNENRMLEIFCNIGISLNLIDFLATTPERLNNGCIPFIGINHESNIFDIIDTYIETCLSLIKREESVDLQCNNIEKWNRNNHKSICLLIDSNPLIRNYLRHAFPLSIIAADRKEKEEMFVLNEYINVVFRPWYHYFDYDNHLYDSWDCITCCRLNREIIVANKINVIDYILNGLNEGYYSDIWIDTYYIPGKYGYGKMHLSHCLLVYGYDSEKNKFITLTYTATGDYERLDVDPDDILKACSNNYFLYINLLKSNKRSQIIYSKDILIEKLKRYINSDYEFAGNTKYNKYDDNQLYNYKACQAFPEYILKTGIKEKTIYLIALYGFVEHKKCMSWRLDYIETQENIKEQKIQRFIEYIKSMNQILINLGIKYNLSKKDYILHRIIDIIYEMNIKEKEAILCLIDTTKTTSTFFYKQ